MSSRKCFRFCPYFMGIFRLVCGKLSALPVEKTVENPASNFNLQFKDFRCLPAINTNLCKTQKNCPKKKYFKQKNVNLPKNNQSGLIIRHEKRFLWKLICSNLKDIYFIVKGYSEFGEGCLACLYLCADSEPLREIFIRITKSNKDSTQS
jgi:hypothetical protein